MNKEDEIQTRIIYSDEELDIIDKENKFKYIVKYNNAFNQLTLKNFNALELDILMALCSQVKERGCRDITFTFDQLKKLSDYNSVGYNRFINDLQQMNSKLLALNFRTENQHEIIQFALFPTFRINKTNRTLTVAVNNEFAYVLNQIEKDFTRFELKEFTGLKSSYSKILYRLLKQFRTTGFMKISLKDLRDKMDAPESYSTKSFNQNVLNVAVKELKNYFKGLKVEKLREGRRVTAYIFTFARENFRDRLRHNISCSNFICPGCGQPLIEKVINGNNCWCHIDGYKSTAKCSRIFNSVAAINNYNETPGRDNSFKRADNERALNQSDIPVSLSEMYESMFSKENK